MFMFKQNQNGSSLIQVLIASALVMTLSLGVSELIVNSSRAQKANAVKFTWSLAQSEILSMISNKDMCTQSITSSAQYLDLTQASDPTGQNISLTSFSGETLSKDAKISNGDLTIQSLSIKNPNKITDISGNKELWSVKLNMSALATQNLLGGKQLSNDLDLGLFLTVDASNNEILECSLTPGDDVLSGVCTSIGGTFDENTGDCDLPKQSASESCAQLGGTYNTSSKKCEIDPDPRTICTTLGGNYSGGKCSDLPSKQASSFSNLRFKCPSKNDSRHGCSSTCSGQQQKGATCTWYKCNAGHAQHREHGHSCSTKIIENCTAI